MFLPTDKVTQSRWFAQELVEYVKNLNPRCHSKISILSGIIWILITGAQWSALPKNEFPPKSTCYYWYRKLSENMDFMILFQSVVRNESKSGVNYNKESYIDAAFVESKNSKIKCGYGWKGKGSNIALLLNQNSDPISFLLAPHRSNRVNLTQDRRKLRSLKRRYKIEQFFAHLQNFRRIVTRYEKITELLEQSSIVVLASHAKASIKKICNKALLLENGTVKYFDNVNEAFDVYYQRLEYR